MQILMRTAFHLSRLRDPAGARAALLIDAETGITTTALTTLVHPWRSWLELADVLVASDPPDEGWLDTVEASGATALLIVSERDGFDASELDAAARARGLRVLGSGYETDSERETAFFQEMSHHHFEIGGLNEWDGAPVKHAQHLLQHISAANCITHFPGYLTDELRERRRALGRPLEALDVGSGSISRLRWGAIQDLLHVTGVDPLIDIYEVVLVHHGLDGLPSISVDRPINANAEELDRHVAAGSFDFAYCHNALDHVEDPPAVVAQVARALRPGAKFALEFATREGSRQQWHQLHQFDLFYDDGREELRCQWRDGRDDPLVAKGVPLAIDRLVAVTDEYTAVVLRHDGARERRGPVRLRALRGSA